MKKLVLFLLHLQYLVDSVSFMLWNESFGLLLQLLINEVRYFNDHIVGIIDLEDVGVVTLNHKLGVVFFEPVS